jgi:tetratricopeptide (TPR) repeat protein
MSSFARKLNVPALLLLTTVLGSGQQIAAAENVPSPEHLLRDEIQELISRESQLDGLRVDCEYNGAILRVRGILGRDGQVEVLKELLEGDREKLETDFASWQNKPRETVTWDYGPWKLLSIDSFRREVQRRAAEHPELRRVRIDRIFFRRDGVLSLHGVLFGPLAGNVSKQRLLAQFRDLVLQAVIDGPWEDYKSGGEVDMDNVTVQEESPVLAARQIVASSKEWDGARIDDGYYDSSGVLVLEGIQDREGLQAARLSEALIRKSSEDDFWRSWIGRANTFDPNVETSTQEHKPALDVRLRPIFFGKQITTILEDAFRRANFSTAINESDPTKGFHDKVRIERVFYNKHNQLALKGIRWNEIADESSPQQKETALVASLRLLAEKIIKENLPDILSPPAFLNAPRTEELVNVDELASAKSGLKALWQWVPSRPELDGVRVDRAYYNAGRLHFTAIEGKPGQVAELAEAIRLGQPDASLWELLSPAGVDFDEVQVVPLPKLMSRLQDRLAQSPDLSGTWIDRAYYNQIRQLRLEVYRWGNASEDQIRQLVNNEIASSQSEWQRALEVHPEPEVAFVGKDEDLVEFLRAAVENRPDLDGVRLDGAVFDDKRVLNFLGLVGKEEQRRLLDELITDTVATHEGWRRLVPNGWNVNSERLRLLRIDPLLECVQNLIPAYEELDGVTIGRLYHLANGRLAMCGRYTGKGQEVTLKGILGVELSRTEQGRIRLEQNETIPPSWEIPVPTNPTDKSLELGRMEEFTITHNNALAMDTFGDAWQLYWARRYDDAIRLLDMSLAYDPRCVEAWYLRSLCYIAKDEIGLARRDIRRGVLVNADSPYRLRARHTYLTRVQGEPRLCFERLFQEALVTRPSCPFVEYYCATHGAEGSCERCRFPCTRRIHQAGVHVSCLMPSCTACGPKQQPGSVQRLPRLVVSCTK